LYRQAHRRYCLIFSTRVASFMSQTPNSTGTGSRLARLPFFYGWVVIGVAFVTMAIGVNARTAFSLLFPPILAEFGWSRGAVAGVFSAGFIASMFFAPVTGILLDKYGPRWMMPVGAILTSIGLALATISTEPWHFYVALGVFVVAGSVFIAYIGHGIFLPNWFVRKRGLAIGIAFSGVGVGAIVLFPILQELIEGVGWREACWALAALLIIVIVPLNIVFQRHWPKDIGLRPDGDTEASDAARNGVRGETDNIVDRAWTETDWTVKRAIRTRQFWWLAVGFFCALFVWYAIQVHQTKYLIESGYDSTLAAFALGLVALFGVIGQISIGHLSDRLGREWGWTISLSGYTICYVLLVAIENNPSPLLLYLMVGAQGVLGYGLAAMFGAISIEIFQGKQYGAIFGSLNAASTLGAATGPWVFGLTYDQTGSYAPAFWLAAALSLLSILCIWRAAPRKIRLVAGQADRRRNDTG
jgi:MFS family permease